MLDTNPIHAIEVDQYSNYNSDSEYTDSCATSLSPSVIDYKYENGRRYHAYREGKYVLPNDEKEEDRMDLAHHLTNILLSGKLLFAPIPPNPKNVLDLGTGTGTWVIDFANEYPTALVIGTDLSPIQPSWHPPNVRFEIDDAENDWTYTKDTFDVIHIRQMVGAFADWKIILRKAFDHLKPSGYLEIQEVDTNPISDDQTLLPNSPFVTWSTHLNSAARLYGRPMDIAPHLTTWLRETGFENITENILKLPINGWPRDPRLKELGKIQLLNMVEGLEGFSLALFTRVLGWKVEDVRELVEKVKVQLRDRGVHCYYRVHVVYARPGSGGGGPGERERKGR